MKTYIFGAMPDGRSVTGIILESESARCELITYGAAVRSLEVPDKNGKLTDVVLGYDSLEDYMTNDKCMGAIAGRCANRIGNSRFVLNGKEYKLFPNIAPHHLHGGASGFDKRLWDYEEIPNGARLTLTSEDMDEGYPGRLSVSVDYTLIDSALHIDYRAVSDKDTICNLTNHAYFNLNGHSSGDVLSHELKLYSSSFTPVSSSESIPTGELESVAGTPMDFRQARQIGESIDSDYSQLRFGSGYDHNWVIDGKPGELRPAAQALSQNTGIFMEALTTLPSLQFYAGNFLDGGPAGKGGAVYKSRSGFCLEMQYYPDTPNKPQFPSSVLRAGDVWSHSAIYRFSNR